MNCKEKAKELFDKMYQNQGLDTLTEDDEQVIQRAKQCALIAVNEILYMLENLLFSPKESIAYNYYLEVRKEIELIN
jgi:hypothetical protein